MRLLRAFAATLAAALVVACSTASSGDATAGEDLTKHAKTPDRDWEAHPAIVEIDDADHIYAVSDIHGHYQQFAALLEANHLATNTAPDPDKARWTGGHGILVVAGDLIDKGPQSLEVIDLLRALEASAKASGGRVIVTMGNHEAEFLGDPKNEKAMSTELDAIGINAELAEQNIDPVTLVLGTDQKGRGRWLSSLPFGARIKKWFFSHGGNSQEMSAKDLGKKLQRSIKNNGYKDKDITDDDSILESQKWYGDFDRDKAGKKEADALGVHHLAFGHDSGAFNDHGHVLASPNEILVKLDTAMGIHIGGEVNRGFLLHVDTQGQDKAEVLDPKGKAEKLF